jgi:hypothetical protein
MHRKSRVKADIIKFPNRGPRRAPGSRRFNWDKPDHFDELRGEIRRVLRSGETEYVCRAVDIASFNLGFVFPALGQPPGSDLSSQLLLPIEQPSDEAE